ncbi:MAG: hypothetical protein DRO05_07180 [Thermoproteota archaeon]|nr:MAG: hypothetical protein DRO05_07180 [Candidatus Korarchaeota archaeon]
MEEIIIKQECEPGPYGFEPRDRPLDMYLDHGIINLDKPRGPTSHAVTQKIRRILRFPGKIGHSGTLATS